MRCGANIVYCYIGDQHLGVIANKVIEILSKLFLSITKWQLPYYQVPSYNILWEQVIKIQGGCAHFTMCILHFQLTDLDL